MTRASDIQPGVLFVCDSPEDAGVYMVHSATTVDSLTTIVTAEGERIVVPADTELTTI